MPPETPLGFLTGKVTIEGLPAVSTGLQIKISAGAKGGGHGAEVTIWPNPAGADFAMPLAPDDYSVFAQFGSAQTPPQSVTIANGKASAVNFTFGK